MFRRSRDFFTDILRQTDLVLLALCAAASLFGILMVASATATCIPGVWWRSSLRPCCWA